MINVIQIVPHLPPTSSGVGDYALLLARELRHRSDITTHFIICNPHWSGSESLEGFNISILRERTKECFSDLLLEVAKSETPVILHYVGYGYENRGCPLWLINGIDRWQMICRTNKLMTYFHELYASGFPWSSAFWTSPIQKWLTKKLSLMSRICATNMNMYSSILSDWLTKDSYTVNALPVFSTVGELDENSNCGERRRELVVFGSPQWRTAVYKNNYKELVRICSILEIECIHDIGPQLLTPLEINVEIVAHGVLSADRVCHIMQSSLAGVLCYPVPYLGKSTIFAAYTANGLLPINLSRRTQENLDSIIIGKNIASINSIDNNELNMYSISQAGNRWYSTHNLASHGDLFTSILRSICY